MPEIQPSAAVDTRQNWAVDLQPALCERCNWRYLMPASVLRDTKKPVLCPHCFQAPLTHSPELLQQAPHPYEPELVAPFTLSDQALYAAVSQFTQGIPFPPYDLNYSTIRARLTPLYLPMWLVDAHVTAFWQAEAGFINHEVVTHQEHYLWGSWQSEELYKSRIHWETRLGRLDRRYQNVGAPALEEAHFLEQTLGSFDLDKAIPYQSVHTTRAWVRLPDRSIQDAWSEASAGFQKWSSAECQQACAADHLRQFRWKAHFTDLNWTLMLLPMYTTYYMDDHQQPQAVLIHGQTGGISGRRQSSMKHAQRVGLTVLLIGLILCVLGLSIGSIGIFDSNSSLIMQAFVTFLLGILANLASLVPLTNARDFNRKQKDIS